MSEDILVTRFREYIRINTMQPTPDYVGADQFIKKYGDELGLKKGSLIRKTHRKLSLTRRFPKVSYAFVPAPNWAILVLEKRLRETDTWENVVDSVKTLGRRFYIIN